jgi:hypothetical protein
MANEPEAGDRTPDGLRSVSGGVKWTAPVAIIGAALLVVAVVLAFVAPSPAWFLLYPVLIVAAVGGLATVAAWLLRHF